MSIWVAIKTRANSTIMSNRRCIIVESGKLDKKDIALCGYTLKSMDRYKFCKFGVLRKYLMCWHAYRFKAVASRRNNSFFSQLSQGVSTMTSYTKKTIVIAMIAAMAIPSLATASRFRGANAGTGTYMVDTDGDGIGDTRPERGTGMGAGAENFVDLDNDGVCDTYAAGGEQLLDGSGRPDWAGQGQGRMQR